MGGGDSAAGMARVPGSNECVKTKLKSRHSLRGMAAFNSSGMKKSASKENKKQLHQLPTRLIIIVAFTLGLAILGSAIFTYTTLLRLKSSYLSNRGHEIAAVIEGQVRGPGRRNNPAFWQSVLESNYSAYSRSAAFLALVDQRGNTLAHTRFSTQSSNPQNDVFIFEEPLALHRNPFNEVSSGVSGWRIRIGLYSSETAFIQRQALIQLAISSLAIVALFALSAGLIRMLSRFFELKVQEGAEAQLKSLGVMAASLAHEIRNPLGAMKGLTQLAQEDLPADHAAQSHLRTVVSEAERLERLVTDLLDFARGKEPQISEFDLMNVISDIKLMLQSKLESSKIQFQITTDANALILRSDSSGLRQVLLNVLINAIDATPSNGTVILSARLNEGRKSVIMQVDDSGTGIGRNDPADLFQPFVTTKTRGTGLGLAISKQIIEKLGGSLNLENLAQGGARCSIELPMS
jgi:signal transduction histidine kinase